MEPECLGSPRVGMFQKFKLFQYSLSGQFSIPLTAIQFRQQALARKDMSGHKYGTNTR